MFEAYVLFLLGTEITEDFLVVTGNHTWVQAEYKHTSSQPAAIFSTSSKEDLTSGDIFACQEGKLLPESSRKRPGVLLSILQCPGQLPTTKSY